jgi:radical SAM-linked protein
VARLLIKFTKTNGAKFISHLDTMRTLHRAFRRAELPISYSKGFNPHASISVAAPLSLGLGSVAEYADVDIDYEMDSEGILSALNEALPMDIKIINIIPINTKMPASMAAVAFARYSIRFDKKVDTEVVEKLIKAIKGSDEIMKMKRSKSGEKLVNIRPFIMELYYESFDSGLIKFECILKAGSNGSLGADAIAQLIKEYSGGAIDGHPYITREEIYALVDDKRIPLDRYFSGK